MKIVAKKQPYPRHHNYVLALKHAFLLVNVALMALAQQLQSWMFKIGSVDL